MLHLTENNFNTYISSGLHLVDVATSWCEPCKQVDQLLPSLSKKHNDICTISKVSSEETSLIIQHNITYFPTILLFKDGKEVERIIGVKTEKEYSDAIRYWSTHTPTKDKETHPLYDISDL